MMRKRHRGLGWFGSLIVLALVVGAAYLLYKELVVGGNASCESEQNECLRDCRRGATDNAAMQSCLARCRRDLDSCTALREANRR
jgi:hypothetical protein